MRSERLDAVAQELQVVQRFAERSGIAVVTVSLRSTRGRTRPRTACRAFVAPGSRSAVEKVIESAQSNRRSRLSALSRISMVSAGMLAPMMLANPSRHEFPGKPGLGRVVIAARSVVE